MKVLVIKWTINEYVLLIIRMFSHGFQSSLLGERVVSVQATAMEVSKWAFAGYGLRWKIEEYHRHIKLEYALEAIQIKTFTGIQPCRPSWLSPSTWSIEGSNPSTSICCLIQDTILLELYFFLLFCWTQYCLKGDQQIKNLCFNTI